MRASVAGGVEQPVRFVAVVQLAQDKITHDLASELARGLYSGDGVALEYFSQGFELSAGDPKGQNSAHAIFIVVFCGRRDCACHSFSGFSCHNSYEIELKILDEPEILYSISSRFGSSS